MGGNKTYSVMDPNFFHSFNADSVPAFFLNVDADSGSLTNADPDPGLTFPSLTVYFSIINLINVGNMVPVGHKTYRYLHMYKSLTERLELRFTLLNYG